ELRGGRPLGVVGNDLLRTFEGAPRGPRVADCARGLYPSKFDGPVGRLHFRGAQRGLELEKRLVPVSRAFALLTRRRKPQLRLVERPRTVCTIEPDVLPVELIDLGQGSGSGLIPSPSVRCPLEVLLEHLGVPEDPEQIGLTDAGGGEERAAIETKPA